MLLKDKVALITGAGRGWGQSIALAYARQGSEVIAVSRTPSEIERTAGLVRAEGGKITALTVDISDDASVSRLAEQVLERFGRLDVLVNNAAQLIFKDFAELAFEEVDSMLKVNLRAALLLCKLFLPAMIQQKRGSIINVSSFAGVRPFEKETVYVATKFALEGFSRSLALEVKKHNIAVNTITPGGASAGVRIKPTSLTQAEFEKLSPSEQEKWADAIVMTEAFVYLALQDGSGVTGERLLAYEFSERIRREGWSLEYRRMEQA